MTAITTALEWSSTAWLTHGDSLGPRQPSGPVCAAARSLLPGQPCPLRGLGTDWCPEAVFTVCFSLCKCPFKSFAGVSWVWREQQSGAIGQCQGGSRPPRQACGGPGGPHRGS